MKRELTLTILAAGTAFVPMMLGPILRKVHEKLRKRPSSSMPVVLGTSSKWRRGVFACAQPPFVASSGARREFPDLEQDFMSPDIDEKAGPLLKSI